MDTTIAGILGYGQWTYSHYLTELLALGIIVMSYFLLRAKTAYIIMALGRMEHVVLIRKTFTHFRGIMFVFLILFTLLTLSGFVIVSLASVGQSRIEGLDEFTMKVLRAFFMTFLIFILWEILGRLERQYREALYEP